MRKIKFLLATIMMLVGTTAQATTITWDSSVINSIMLFEVNESYTNSGITVKMTAMDMGGFYGGKMMSAGTATFVFSSTVGNIKGIVITAERVDYFNNDWSVNSERPTLTWSGTPASSVTMSSSPISIRGISSIVFTIEEPTVAVTSITLSQTEASMTVGGTLTLTPTVLPDNATDKTVTWTTSDESVATVADGVVTAVAAGTATITVTTTDGAKTATCTVTVAEPTYTVTVKDGTEDAANWSATPNPAKAGETVTITYNGTKKVKSVKAVKK